MEQTAGPRITLLVPDVVLCVIHMLISSEFISLPGEFQRSEISGPRLERWHNHDHVVVCFVGRD